eukprot:scaffold39538_cov76-Phaeocystis_antarctica.AAC.1
MATALSPAARYMCAAVIYTRSRSCSLLTLYIDRKIWPERCSLAQRSGGLRGRIAGTGTA